MKASPLQSIDAIRQIEAVPLILETITRVTGMGFAAVARITDDRWIACDVRDEIGFGMTSGDELPSEVTFCQEIERSHRPIVIPDVLSDADFCDHPSAARFGFRSYISFPILLPDGRFFGTVCAIDPEPRDLERSEVQGLFRLSADLLGFHLEMVDKLTISEAKWVSEREAGELREQFIAVLGHDLRNPLAAVQAGVTMLGRRVMDGNAVILGHMQNSIDRMGSLIENVLDLARGRLGGGLSLKIEAVQLGTLLSQIVGELTRANPDRDIRLECSNDVVVHCDSRRVGQLVSNLVGNAVTHGAADQPVRVSCKISEGILGITVTNGGEAIPAAAMAQLFHPFVRAAAGKKQEGLGLGLYIASEIAAAHGGTLTVQSSDEETRFTFRVPIPPQLRSSRM